MGMYMGSVSCNDFLTKATFIIACQFGSCSLSRKGQEKNLLGFKCKRNTITRQLEKSCFHLKCEWSKKDWTCGDAFKRETLNIKHKSSALLLQVVVSSPAEGKQRLSMGVSKVCLAAWCATDGFLERKQQCNSEGTETINCSRDLWLVDYGMERMEWIQLPYLLSVLNLSSTRKMGRL